MFDLFSIDANYDYGDTYITFTSAALVERDLRLHVQVRNNSSLAREDERLQHWQLTCRGVRDNHLQLGSDETGLSIHEDHPILWPHVKDRSELYCNCVGLDLDIDSVFGGLYRRHVDLVQDWFKFGSFFNPMMFKTGFGFLATGPEPLVSGYEQVMSDLGCRTSMRSSKPRRWENGGFVDDSGPLVALAGGTSWLVAESVESTRLPTSHEVAGPPEQMG